ncbi:MAG: hypothetical protein K2G44_05935 [Clostridia bacterium]|nr:hypothetical protein [Clostridia bacterium]
MSALNELLEYQKVDGELRKIEQDLAASEERKKYVQAKKFMEGAREKLEAQDKRAVELKAARDRLIERCEETAKAIDEYSDLDEMLAGGGDISFYKKNAQALSERLRALKNELNTLLADITAASEEYKKFNEQGKSMQKQFKEYSEKYKEVKSARADEAAGITKQLEKLSKKIPADIMEKYNQKRKERIFPILVPLTSGRCVCGMDLSLAQQGKLAGGNVIECEHCRRFIYKAD